MEQIKNVLIKLSMGDLIEYSQMGNWFRQIKDPILNEFLKVWGRINVVGEAADSVRHETVKKYRALLHKFAEHKGYLAEVYMIQMLWNSQRQILPGKYFHSSTDIAFPDWMKDNHPRPLLKRSEGSPPALRRRGLGVVVLHPIGKRYIPIPARFFYIDHRNRQSAGQGIDIDIYAAAGEEVWIAESKWWVNRKVGIKIVKHLITQAERVKEREGPNLQSLQIWLFAYDGVTEEAETLMRQHQILWSTHTDLDALLTLAKLRTLPKL